MGAQVPGNLQRKFNGYSPHVLIVYQSEQMLLLLLASGVQYCIPNEHVIIRHELQTSSILVVARCIHLSVPFSGLVT